MKRKTVSIALWAFGLGSAIAAAFTHLLGLLLIGMALILFAVAVDDQGPQGDEDTKWD